MEKREFYTLEDLKEFLNFDDTYPKLSDYCQENVCSMVIPLTSSIGQSIPSFFYDTEPDMQGAILHKETNLFKDIIEIVNYWIATKKEAKLLPKLNYENKQTLIEAITKYLIAFESISKTRKAFPIEIDNTYTIEELWMKEGYISIIHIKHIKKDFTEEEKENLKNIKKSLFIYIGDCVRQSFL